MLTRSAVSGSPQTCLATARREKAPMQTIDGGRMARRGFFAELNYQAQQAEKRRLQQQAALARAQLAASREAERARKAAERARDSAARASDAERKAAEKRAGQLHVESRVAEVESLNAELANTYAEIDRLLASTLEVDDFVDLNELKITTVEHPPFDPGKLGNPTAPMRELVYPPQPVYQEPPAPTGLSGVFGGKKKHQEAVERAKAEHHAACQRHHERATAMYNDYMAERSRRQQAEEKRLAQLAEAETA